MEIRLFQSLNHEEGILKVQLLIKSGYHIVPNPSTALIVARATFKDGWNALHYACSEGHIEIVDILIDFNADPNLPCNTDCWRHTTTDTKFSPLMLAALNGHAEIVKKLVEKKSDINYRDTNGETALYLASYSGRNEIVDILLKANANPNIYTCKH